MKQNDIISNELWKGISEAVDYEYRRQLICALKYLIALLCMFGFLYLADALMANSVKRFEAATKATELKNKEWLSFANAHNCKLIESKAKFETRDSLDNSYKCDDGVTYRLSQSRNDTPL